MRPEDRGHRTGGQTAGAAEGGTPDGGRGGMPDGLLIGLLLFLLGTTVLVWTATGLSGLFADGAWPHGVTFSRTPLAMRHLMGQPHDIRGAWPDTPADQLSGYGLFWGLFIAQLMVLVVLTVFVLGTLTRWRAVRARRRAEARNTPPAARTEPARPAPETPTGPAAGPAAPPTAGPVAPGAAVTPPAPAAPPVMPPPVEAAPAPGIPASGVPAPRPAVDDGMPRGPRPGGARAGDDWEHPSVLLGHADSRRPAAVQAVRDASGPTVVVTSDPSLWAETKDARAKLGPVLLYDPSHLCDTPARLHWSPTAGCEDRETAKARAEALLAPVRPTAKIDQALADTAETLLRCYLHAAAVDGRAVRHLHRWAQGTGVQEAVRALRTNPKASHGTAGELEAALTSYPDRRDMAQELTARALSSLFTVNIREACTPHRSDALALDSFVNEGGTLYVVGEPIEDPRQHPGAMPLLTALVSHVVERGRRMAERSSAGRLDPPLALVLEDVAAVAPLPRLPELLDTGADRGLPTLALLRSREQLRSRWPQYRLPV
ncbi:type IV secretory system conjugative DNA transfer family protein [Streptomyces jietaisiensis]|uniref:type IV secretory system conjugative DNA transfer family protein n=1 Tax=Streptomyces griseoaurantiacus TaxID=68213 RepID=UPI002E307FD0|nr:type IV secretory system conjugative DNA transfer family protein [Streptomyces jietaisiensis]